MIPTIDIGVTSVLAAIGSFLVALWGIIVKVFEWCQNKFILFVTGTRFGRAVAEFGLFAVIMSFWVAGLNYLVSAFAAYVFEEVFPSDLASVFSFINNFFPIYCIVRVIVYGFTFWSARHLIFVGYSRFRFLVGWLSRVMHVGKI